MKTVYDTLVNDLGMSDVDARIREYRMKNFIMLLKILLSLGVIFFFLGEFFPFVLVNLILIFSRDAFGGIHFKKALYCFLLSLSLALGIVYGSYLDFPIIFKVGIYIFVTICWYKFVPKGTSMFPIRKEEVRKRKRYVALFIIVIACIPTFLLPDRYANIILLSLFANILLVLPITYKIFGVQEERKKAI